MLAPRVELEWWYDHDELVSLARWMNEIGRFVTCAEIIDFFEKPYVWSNTHADFRTQQLLDERLGEDDSTWDIRDEDGDFWEEHPAEDHSHIIRGALCEQCVEDAVARNNQTKKTYCYDHLQEVLT